MSILTRKLTEHELAAVENESTPVAHETFSQIFSVDRGQLEVLDPFSATPPDEDDETPPSPMRLTPAVVAWIATYGGTIGTLIYLAGGGR
ncbi:hypothetical protein [Rhodococcus sp. Chr-9]|uniref:hypothetical protein n=1 Tax=Rhodococcus sp. Chr-9 TaxID=713612 RepID=UPI0005747FC2|nr:hypothetical protein [Rhodococcus sp. Chr-9]KHJ74681.1 hypothetical protein QR64_00420 [Rhodococcus sp. Chr-9]